MMTLIQKLSPNILILEEVSFTHATREQVYSKLNSLGYPTQNIVFCQAEILYGSPFGNMIASKFPLMNTRNIKLATFQESRCAVVVDIQLPNQQIIRVYGFHLDVFDITEQTCFNQISQILNDDQNSPIQVF